MHFDMRHKSHFSPSSIYLLSQYFLLIVRRFPPGLNTTISMPIWALSYPCAQGRLIAPPTPRHVPSGRNGASLSVVGSPLPTQPSSRTCNDCVQFQTSRLLYEPVEFTERFVSAEGFKVWGPSTPATCLPLATPFLPVLTGLFGKLTWYHVYVFFKVQIRSFK